MHLMKKKITSWFYKGYKKGIKSTFGKNLKKIKSAIR
jgi:hypothetical protein